MLRRQLAIVAGLFLVACGYSPAGRTSASSATSASGVLASPSSRTSSNATFKLLPPSGVADNAPQISCSRSIGSADAVAIVQLHDGSTVLRDYADVTRPYTACQIGNPAFVAQLIDAHHVVMAAGSGGIYAVVDLPQVQIHYFQLPGQTPTFIAVSPGLDAVAWLTANLTNNTDEVHVATAAGAKVVASLPNPHGGRCGSPEDSKVGAYSPDGRYLFVLDQPVATSASLLVLDGIKTALRLAPDSTPWAAGAQPAMALWSATSDTLYYRKSGTAWMWTVATGTQMFIPSVSWYYPTISADGRHLAFAELQQDGLHTVSMVDLPPTSRPILVNGHRTLPAFLNASQLWYKSEAQGVCGPGGQQPLVYDIADRTESASIIDLPVAVWPSTSSNF